MTGSDGEQAAGAGESRVSVLVEELRELEERVRQGGGPKRVARQHEQGKLTARERIALLLDPRTTFQEIGLLVAYDRYEGQAPAAGVVWPILRDLVSLVILPPAQMEHLQRAVTVHPPAPVLTAAVVVAAVAANTDL